VRWGYLDLLEIVWGLKRAVGGESSRSVQRTQRNTEFVGGRHDDIASSNDEQIE
jgi:hypothetical protein